MNMEMMDFIYMVGAFALVGIGFVYYKENNRVKKSR